MMDDRLEAAYAEVEDARRAQHPPRGHYGYLRTDGTIGFAACVKIQNSSAALNERTAAEHVARQLPSDGYAWLEEIGGR